MHLLNYGFIIPLLYDNINQTFHYLRIILRNGIYLFNQEFKFYYITTHFEFHLNFLAMSFFLLKPGQKAKKSS